MEGFGRLIELLLANDSSPGGLEPAQNCLRTIEASRCKETLTVDIGFQC